MKKIFYSIAMLLFIWLSSNVFADSEMWKVDVDSINQTCSIDFDWDGVFEDGDNWSWMDEVLNDGDTISWTYYSWIYGGVLMLTSAANPENVEKGKKVTMWTILALLVIMSSYAIVNSVINLE